MTEEERLARLRTLSHELLELLGEDPAREGLLKTPDRVARAWIDLTEGYRKTVDDVVGEALFAAEGSEMVIVREVEVMSMCEHHMLPFYGRCHVAYLPDAHVIGLSKIARIVDLYARRLQVQERLTTQVADALNEAVKPHGVGVVIEAKHMCMMMRGVEKSHSEAVTSALRGRFRSDPATRAEFLSLVSHQMGH